jgi:hypothetical protein
MKPEDKEYGEGNYKASREYKEATEKFVKSGKVEEAAGAAKPKSAEEERDMKRAEEIGKSHSKGEDHSRKS